MGYITSVEFDKPVYAPGDSMYLTVRYTRPPNSDVYIALTTMDGITQLPVPAIRVSTNDGNWVLVGNEPEIAVFEGTAHESGTVIAYLDWLGNRETRTAQYTVQQEWSLRVGWDNRNVQNMFALYPRTASYAVYQGPTQLFPAWNSPLLETYPYASIHMHFKNPELLTREAILQHIGTMPEVRKEAIREGISQYWLSYHHEPEQQTGDDPPDDVWRDRWLRWTDETLPSLPTEIRELFKVGPHYTDYYRRHNTDWDARYGVVASECAVEFVAFSVYDNESEPYRTTEDMFDSMLNYAATQQLPLIVGEYNRNRESTTDPDGAICAQRMRDDFAYLANHIAPRVLAVHQFHNGGGDLTTRPNEQQAFREAMETYWPFGS